MYLRLNFIILLLFLCVNRANAADFDRDNSGKILFKVEGFGIIKETKNELNNITTYSYNTINEDDAKEQYKINFQYQGMREINKKIIYDIRVFGASLTTFIAKYIAFEFSSGVSIYDVNTRDISKNIKIKDEIKDTASSADHGHVLEKYLFWPLSGMIQIHLPIKWFNPYVGGGYSGNFKLTNLNQLNHDLIKTSFSLVGAVGVNIDLPQNIILSASVKYTSYDHEIYFLYLDEREKKYRKSGSTSNIIESLSFYGGLGIKL
jgi:outer membrane protein W